jgi:F0F1-type ATP synthase assembly protein I
MGWLVGKVKEYVALLKLMQPIAKFRLCALVIDGVLVLAILGYLFEYLCFTYFLFSVAVMIIYILGLLIYRFR